MAPGRLLAGGRVYTRAMSGAPRAKERAYQRLRAEILDGTLPANTVLYEVEQATRLGVSRTPVREALGRLLADGLVTPAVPRGLAVTALDVEDIRMLFEVRAALEASAAQLAARRREPGVFEDFVAAFRDAVDVLMAPRPSIVTIDAYYALIRRFDTAIEAAAGNRYLAESLDTLRMHVARVRRLAGASPDRLAASAEEHALIAQAIADGDGVLAEHTTHVHIHRSLEHVTSAFAAAMAHPADSA